MLCNWPRVWGLPAAVTGGQVKTEKDGQSSQGRQTSFICTDQLASRNQSLMSHMSWHYQVNLDTLDRVYLFSIKIICRPRRPGGKLIHAWKKLKGRQRFTQVSDVRRNCWELGEEIQRQFLWLVLIWVQPLAWWWVIGSVYDVSATNTPESCWLILDYMLHLFNLGKLV